VNFPEKVRIFNKVGLSYGFMEDVAYVVDTNLNSGLFVSCVLFANEDGYMNDGKYEYNTIGFPFMKRLGEILLNHHRMNSGKSFPLPDSIRKTIYETQP
ncbi:MAG: hypothetical protein K2Q22_17290, partial [Cytophagales bacterium]|nr:hypothetical protein [Cytophagales bacterium]